MSVQGYFVLLPFIEIHGYYDTEGFNYIGIIIDNTIKKNNTHPRYNLTGKNNIPGFDDLIFEKRNKEYGAYLLRKNHNINIILGVVISTFLGCCVVLIPFWIRKPGDIIYAGSGRFVQVRMESLEPPPEEFYVPSAPPPPEEPAKVKEIVKYVPPEIVDTVITIDKLPAITDEIIAQPERTIAETVGPGGFGTDILGGEGGYGTDEPFFLVEVMPTFRGGDINEFRKYIQKRTNYPQEAVEKKIQGRVFLTFIVEPDGSVSNVTIVKGVDPLIDNEALKAVRSSPDWSPGLQRGQPVRVRYSMWLSFII